MPTLITLDLKSIMSAKQSPTYTQDFENQATLSSLLIQKKRDTRPPNGQLKALVPHSYFYAQKNPGNHQTDHTQQKTLK